MKREKVVPSEERLESIRDAYERGQMLEALRRATEIAPLDIWDGARACVLGARIAANTGAPRLACRLSLRALRAAPGDPEVRAQHGYEVLSRRGPLALWELMRDVGGGESGSGEGRAEILSLRARAATDLRDFSMADQLLCRAEALDPDRPWVRLQRAHWLEAQDRVEQALETATSASALHRHPHYRPAAQIRAHLLQQLDRDEEAIALLQEADAVLQSGPITAQLYAVLSEKGQWDAAAATLERYAALSPLMEPGVRKWVDGQRIQVAYHLGRREEAARLAGQMEGEYYRGMAARLQGSMEPPERIQLPVAYVRQSFKTCAPATLAALGKYWGMSADHQRVVEAVCYDGTPCAEQRAWAEENGWAVREFRVTAAAAMALLERGVPFALGMVGATSGHMVAVVGFDRICGTLLLRDPGQPYLVETQTTPFLEQQRAFGPRGTVFLPRNEAGRIEGLELPEAALYDHCHRLTQALSRHDRGEALTQLRELEALDSEARLTWEARLELASYDADQREQARCLDRLLEIFGRHPARLLRRFSCLRDASRLERIQFLESNGQGSASEPALLIALARESLGDAREAGKSRRLLSRALRLQPTDSAGLSAWADLLWTGGDVAHATDYYRFAACVDGFNEQLYQTWFLACRRTRLTEQALQHLEERFARLGTRSSQPGLTLGWAWHEMEQPERARTVLAEAARLRPEDGFLKLRSAAMIARVGPAHSARALLEAARGKVRHNDWLRAAAEVAEMSLDTRAVLRWARELLELEPPAVDAHMWVARALARLEGSAAALEHLRQAQARFPHHHELRRRVVAWSREAGPLEVEKATRELLALDPTDAWARRERALALVELRRGEEALVEADEAARISPGDTYSYSVRSKVLTRLGRVPEARADYRRAIELRVDNEAAIQELLSLVPTDTERQAELEFIARELVRQVVTGDGLLAYLDIARPVLESAALLALLQRALRERPDLWHAWSAVGQQMAHLGRLDEALALAAEAARRFSHLPRVWLDLACVHQYRDEKEAELEALERAFELNPGWTIATRALTSAWERRNRLEDAERVLARALQHAPWDAQSHALHGHVLWRCNRIEEALSAVERALRLAPMFDWAWELLTEWSTRLNRVERPVALARELVQERPGETGVWMVLARVLPPTASCEERLEAVGQALQLNCQCVEAWELKAEILVANERFDEALRACEDGVKVCACHVHLLHGRQAWVEAQRRNLKEAVRLMREVLRENVDYPWGWSHLVRWLLEQEEVAGAAAALETLQRLRPRDGWVNRQLGWVRLRQDDQPGARKAFEAALKSDPTDAHAAHKLLDLQLGEGDADAAQATLQVMRVHQPGAATLAALVRCRVRDLEPSSALESYRHLCVSSDPDPWPLDTATEAIARSSAARKALKVLKQAIWSGSANPQAGAAAVRLLLARRSQIAATWLFLRFKPGELQRRAASVLVHGLGDAGDELLLKCLVWGRGRLLVQDDESWGQTGCALVKFKRMKRAARWLADWRQRSQAQPWMLFNLCLALRSLGRYSEATEVAQHVAVTWGHRAGAADLRLFLAVEAALSGQLAVAEEHARNAIARDTVDYDQQLMALAGAAIELRQTTAAERPRQARAICQRLQKPFKGDKLFGCGSDVRRTFRRTAGLFRREGAGALVWLWFVWKLYWPWLFLLPLGLLFYLLSRT